MKSHRGGYSKKPLRMDLINTQDNIKNSNLLLLLAGVLLVEVINSVDPAKPATPDDDDFRSGDIIFQTSKSSQSKAIQIATNSKYSHMRII